METRGSSNRGDETRRRILDVAIRAFGTLPYSGVSVAAIAREARTSQPNVYTHFGSKADLYRAAFQHQLERTIGSISHAVVLAAFPDVLAATAQALVEHVTTDPLLARALAETEDDKLQQLLVMPAYDRIRSILAERLAEGQREGQIRPDIDPATTAMGATSVIMSMVISHVHWGRPPIDSHADAVLAVLRQIIIADVGAGMADQPSGGRRRRA